MPCANADIPASSLSQLDAEEAVLCLVNEFRVQEGLQKLSPNLHLRTAARQHAQAAANIRWWKGGGPKIHTNPVTNSTPASRIKDAGYCSAESAPPTNENGRHSFVWGQDPPLQDFTPQSAFEFWRDSMDGHRETMLNPDYRETGVAVVPGVAEMGSDANRPDARGYIFVQTFGGCTVPVTPNTGLVRAWGFNPHGQLGDNSTTDRLTQVGVMDLDEVRALVGGGRHSLALTKDGRVWAWGLNDEGQLGDGTTVNKLKPNLVSDLPPDIVAIAAGDFHSLALAKDGTVWAWGNNDSGQLGDGTATTRLKPQPVVNHGQVKYIAAGSNHSLAIDDEKMVWGWGDNSGGQLGPSTASHHRIPVPQNIGGVKAVDGGNYHTLALKDDGSLWAWGANGVGQLGDRSLANRATPGPVATSSLAGAFMAIAAGGAHNVALEQNGKVWSWGYNFNGQLGNGAEHADYAWEPTRPHYQRDVVAIAAGAAHSLTVKGDGSVWAWGNNSNGALGNGSTVHSFVPVQSKQLSGMNAVAAGLAHSMAV